jgi:hypothetical protein
VVTSVHEANLSLPDGIVSLLEMVGVGVQLCSSSAAW